MSAILDLLARQAAEWRQTARDHGIAAEEARPHADKARAETAAALVAVQHLEQQLADLQAQLATAQQAHTAAAYRHGQAVALVEQCERDGREAADIADELDALAARHRDGPQPPTSAQALSDATTRDHDPDDPPPPGGTLVATSGPTVTGPLAPAPADPMVTMPDEQPDEQRAEAEGPRHAAPKKPRGSGPFRIVTGLLGPGEQGGVA